MSREEDGPSNQVLIKCHINLKYLKELAKLQLHESQPAYRHQEKDDLAVTLELSLVQNSTHLLPQFKKAAVVFLKLLVILLLLSPYGHAATDNVHEVYPSKEIETQVAEVHTRTDPVADIQNASPLTHVQAHPTERPKLTSLLLRPPAR